MLHNYRIICVIPARLQSTRFPQKVLAQLAGKPLLQWVYEAAQSCGFFDEILFAVDAKETFELVTSFGARALYTDPSCENGTRRLLELCSARRAQGDIWVCWQADEPFVNREMILKLLGDLDPQADVWTLKKKLINPEQMEDPNVVKVVTDSRGFALYFSRHCIPFQRKPSLLYKHLGIYAFSNNSLTVLHKLPPCDLENSESLEQLRFLYHGLKIKVHEVEHETVGIDTPDDLKKAEKYIYRTRFKN